MRERVHNFRYCPQCKANVEPFYRFCRSCYCWLARSREGAIRELEPKSSSTFGDYFSRFKLGQMIFESSFPMMISSCMVLMICFLLMAVYYSSMIPNWLAVTPKMKRSACYSNQRVIQTAIEQYCMEHRFTHALASDPSLLLFQCGYLRSQAHCPISGNMYKIPRGSRLQCVGSEGHGIAW